MSRSYAESNKEKTSDLFNKRVLYKLKARRSASGVRNIVEGRTTVVPEDANL